MGKRLFVTILILTLFPAWPSAEAVYKVKKKPTPTRPVFASPEEERAYRLRKGEVVTEGGYLKKGVWGKMEGVIEAPPEIVWRLFIHVNEWKRYGLPNLVDSRAVDEGIVREVGAAERVENFYRVLGDRVIDPTARRVRGTVWTGLAFQYFDLPWPVANRWMIVKNTYDERRAAEGVFRSDWTKAAGNVRTLNGSFVLEPFEGNRNRTLMVYRVESDPGATVPKFLLRWGLNKTMPAAMRVIRREAVRLWGTPAPLLKTQ